MADLDPKRWPKLDAALDWRTSLLDAAVRGNRAQYEHLLTQTK